MAVGLHILYGLMGSGKTNYAVNKFMAETSYNHIICNVPLTEKFLKELEEKGKKVEIFPKMRPNDVIQKISGENPQTFFIVDESQLTLTSLNVSACKEFAKKMSQIRQDDQDVTLIAQNSKMLPTIIKATATDCYLFQNKNVKGVQKESYVTSYEGGSDFSTRKIETFTWHHVYGNYETSNWESTEKPKNLYKRQYIKLFVFIALALALFGFVGYSGYRLFHSGDDSEEIDNSNSTMTEVKFNELQNQIPIDTSCIRSYIQGENGIFFVINSKGEKKALSTMQFISSARCPLP